MKISYDVLKEEIISTLEKNRVWVLSTSKGDTVTSRSMSIINEGLDIYFQTNACYTKYSQMNENPNVALCFSNISIEGTAEILGNWQDTKNESLLVQYKTIHKGSFDYYGMLDGQVVYKVTPHKVKVWKYKEGKPYREVLDVNQQSAERLDFM